MLTLATLWAFIRRDFLSMVSYRLAFVMHLGGIFLSLAVFYYMTQMMDPKAAGLDGIRPYDFMLIGLTFATYFSTALYAFASRIRNEQMMGTLEAMLVSPTRTHVVVFGSAVWDFTYGALRMLFYLGLAELFFDVGFKVESWSALWLGVALTLLSSAGVGILSASFIIYFKRGDPINFLLSGASTLLGGAFFPVEQLPEWLRGLSKLVPLHWSLEVVRGSLLKGQTLAELGTALWVLLGFTAVLLPLGLWASRFAIRKAKREGSLIQY